MGRPGTLTHPDAAELSLGAVLQAVADPVRAEMVRQIDALSRGDGTGEAYCGALDLPVSASTGSHHFRVLREAGVIRQRDEGQRRYNTLRRDDLDARFPGLLDLVLRG
jgi:DNA-binding transcriptional ArsR family regulator